MQSNDRLFLTFHGLGVPDPCLPKEEVPFWVSQSVFREIVDFCKGNPQISITIDDGNLSDLDLALPILTERKLIARFFVLTGRIGRSRYLSAHHLRHLDSAGALIGTHGCEHVSWRQLDDKRLTQEILDSRTRLEDVLGKPVSEASFPFGSYGRRALRFLRRKGFTAVYTSDGGPCSSDWWLRPRNTIRSGDTVQTVRNLAERSHSLPRRWGTRLRLGIKAFR